MLLLEDMPDTLIYINLNMPGQGKIAKCETLGRLWAAVLFIMLSWTISKFQVVFSYVSFMAGVLSSPQSNLKLKCNVNT